jgi:hypothetical protein
MRGRYEEESHPPARPVLVHLPEPLIVALDAFGKRNGTGRGRSITTLLNGILEVSETPVVTEPARKNLVSLELVQRTDPFYVQYRKNHYIPDRGVVGQQLQYLIFYGTEIIGIIGGSSCVYANEFRDEYFTLSDNKDLKTRQLNSIINNNIFKLDYPAPNMASIVLGLWRRRVVVDWEGIYGVAVAGFETFVVEERLWNGKTRNGACYRADNWELVGITKGYGNTNVRGRETKNKNLKSRKLVYCRKIKGVDLCDEYQTSWGNPKRQQELNKKRSQLMSDPLDVLLKTIS